MGSEFKVFNNALYDGDLDDSQLIFCHNVYKGALHGIVNPLFEEHLEVSDLVELDVNVDMLSYCCEKLECSSSICDSECCIW